MRICHWYVLVSVPMIFASGADEDAFNRKIVKLGEMDYGVISGTIFWLQLWFSVYDFETF